ncbi:RNA polymerase sigma factor [Flagellimonas sp. S174]|uniref:RNA polymerase sigma factor n=1 Tax=Flagellimonas sp. S174 TaxID=3410790 RepID=UPI003BF5F36B
MTEQEIHFKHIYQENYPKVMRLCMGYVGGNKELADDLTQEVFIKTWNNLKTFRQESNITTWIYRIAVNTCLMNLRKRKRNQPLVAVDSHEISDGSDATEGKERQYQEMYRCIDTLSVTNKAIILMELEGLAQKDIAKVIGLKHEAIRTRIHRIKMQLSKCVEHE